MKKIILLLIIIFSNAMAINAQKKEPQILMEKHDKSDMHVETNIQEDTKKKDESAENLQKITNEFRTYKDNVEQELAYQNTLLDILINKLLEKYAKDVKESCKKQIDDATKNLSGNDLINKKIKAIESLINNLPK